MSQTEPEPAVAPAAAGTTPSTTSTATAAATATPMLRLLGDLGSWTLGEPLTAGEGEVLVQVRLDALDELLVTLGADGVRALIAVLRHARPVRDADGKPQLELPGYSGAWLRETVGLSERSAYRASNALRDAGLLTTASLDDTRGAAGGQRAILSGLVGLPGGGAGVRPTRRGRAAGSAVSTNVRNRSLASVPDGSAVSTDPQNRDENPQVSALSTDCRKGLSTTRSSRSSSQEERPSESSSEPARRRASPTPAGSELASMCAAPTLFALQRSLERTEQAAPGSLAAALRAVTAVRSEPAERLVRALRLSMAVPAVTAVADFLALVLSADPTEIVGDTGGGAGHVVALLRSARVAIPSGQDPSTLLARVVASVVAGLDSEVKSWPRWLASGLSRPCESWGQTASHDRLREVLDRVWREELLADASSHSDQAHDVATTPPPPGPDQNGASPSPEPSAEGSAGVPAAPVEEPAGWPGPELVEEHLAAAIATQPYYAKLGLVQVRAKERVARGLVAEYLRAGGQGPM